jgi:hypothetical protein
MGGGEVAAVLQPAFVLAATFRRSSPSRTESGRSVGEKRIPHRAGGPVRNDNLVAGQGPFFQLAGDAEQA